jgi:hypothetical protein
MQFKEVNDLVLTARPTSPVLTNMLVYHHSKSKLFNNNISNASKHCSSSNNSNSRKWLEVLARHSSYRQLLVNRR